MGIKDNVEIIVDMTCVSKSRHGHGWPQGTVKHRKGKADMNPPAFIATWLLHSWKSMAMDKEEPVYKYERIQVIVSPLKKQTEFPPNSWGYCDASPTPVRPVMESSHITPIASGSTIQLNTPLIQNDVPFLLKDFPTLLGTLTNGCKDKVKDIDCQAHIYYYSFKHPAG